MTTKELQEIQMSYQGLVEAGREARQQADNMQWTEGDLALQVEALPANERPRDPETGEFIEDEAKTLQRYAEDIDCPYSTVRKYRATAKAWPHDRRTTEVSHEVHKILAAQEDRFDLVEPGMTTREAVKIVRKRNAGTVHEPGWFELLGEVADTLVRAGKQLGKVEDAITRKPNKDFCERAEEYAEAADEIAERLREVGR